MVAALHIRTEIGEDRRLVVDLPENTPTGLVELTIRAVEPTPTATTSAREAVRVRLLEAGILVTQFEVPDDVVQLSPEALLEVGTMPPDARSSLDLINEDRGEW